MSESVSLATEYLTENEDIEEYKEFKTDATGQKLRYKILIK
jgi:hypothetical protein